MLNVTVDRKNSIDAYSIALLKGFLLFGFPNKRVLTILSSFSVKMSAFERGFVFECYNLRSEEKK